MSNLEIYFYSISSLTIFSIYYLAYLIYYKKKIISKKLTRALALLLLINLLITMIFFNNELIPEMQERNSRNQELIKEYYCSNNIPSSINCTEYFLERGINKTFDYNYNPYLTLFQNNLTINIS